MVGTGTEGGRGVQWYTAGIENKKLEREKEREEKKEGKKERKKESQLSWMS